MLGIPFLDYAVYMMFHQRSVADGVDILNYFVSSTLLAFFAIMVSAKQYVGSPMSCWVPNEMRHSWVQYAEDYCFIENTFFVPFRKAIPDSVDDRTKSEITYYQWVPIVLALQAIMFYLPNYLWKKLHHQNGIDLSTAVQEARKLRGDFGDHRKKEIGRLTAYLEECLQFQDPTPIPSRIFCFRFGSNLGSYMSMLYLSVKFLYVLNIFLQFYILSRFLGSNYTLWGWETFNDLWHGREWMESGVFPRVTLCDFQVRRLANIQRYTVQCVLMINLFNEKIYLFLWFWFLFVALSTSINFFYSFIQLVPTHFREKSTKTWLASRTDDDHDYRHDSIIKRFAHTALRPDGILILRFIEGHAGTIVVREIAHKLFLDYMENLQTDQYERSINSVSLGIPEDGPHENIYPPEKLRGLMAPNYPSKQV